MPDSAHAQKRPGGYRIAGRTYIPARGLIRTERGTARLEPRLSRLLDLFIAAPGRELYRGDILDAVWPEQGSDEALTQAVSRLRRHLGHEAIRTLPRIGYVFTAQADPVEVDVDTLAPPTGNWHSWRRLLSRHRAGAGFAAGLAAGLAMAVLAAPLLFTKQIEIEETIAAPGEDVRIVRTSAACSLLISDCEAGPDN
ncbi:winged helix-turn-helix domain-containing protein [Hyphobacterium sp.]|jgi:DNA-binding winged helix-turn-helix (wHTH) protein|uniref:winged helix-turn-helix domain-containing protein n=1 Tax=Hyphobacterium sp. TaxID=2004662 RepID=UPI003BAAA075